MVATRTILAPYRHGPMHDRGALIHHPWMDVPSVKLSLYDGTPAPDEQATSVRVCHDETKLYVLFLGRYQQLRTAPATTPLEPPNERTPRLWDLSDVYELFIGPDAKESRLYREFQVGPDSRKIDIDVDASGDRRKTDLSWDSGFFAQSVLLGKEKVWEALLQIPFGAFSIIPECDEEWSCNFYRIGHEPSRCYMAWSPVYRIAFHQPQYFGAIRFTGP
jgi:hypothetical protein